MKCIEKYIIYDFPFGALAFFNKDWQSLIVVHGEDYVTCADEFSLNVPDILHCFGAELPLGTHNYRDLVSELFHEAVQIAAVGNLFQSRQGFGRVTFLVVQNLAVFTCRKELESPSPS